MIMKTLLLKIGLVGVLFFNLSFTALSQAYTTGYPTITNITSTSAVAEVNATVGGRGFYTSFVVLPSTEQPPTIQNVIAWTEDGNGGSIPLGQYGDIYLFAANTTCTFDITNLLSNTSYIAYFVTHQNWISSVIETTTPTSFTFSTPPILSISELFPVNDATGVPTDSELIITFNQNISRGSGSMTIYDSQGGDFQTISASSTNFLEFSGNQLIISHNIFNPSTEYYVLMDDGFVTGFSGITDPNTWNFTTSAGAPSWNLSTVPNVYYPIMTGQTSSSVGLEMEIDQNGFYYSVITNSLTQPTPANIEAGLNENGNAAQLTNSGSLTANTTITSSIDISGLDKDAIYYLHIVASNGSEYTNIKSFQIDLISPFLSSISPANGSRFRPVDTNITLNFSEKIYAASNHSEITTGNISNYITISDGSGTVSYTPIFSNSDKTITLTPNAPLAANTTYTISFASAFEDEHENEQSEKTGNKIFSTKEPNQIIWIGNDSSWGTPGNWDEGTIPQSSQNVFIPANIGTNPEINTETVSVNDLTIEAGASLTQLGGSLTISGVFTLESTIDGNASYLPKGGTLDISSGSTQFHQHIEANNRNYNFGVSVNETTKTSAGITNNLYQYNNDNNTLVMVPDGTPLNPGTGYLCRSDNSLVFTGTPTTSDLTISVQRNNSGGLGWNFIANPFTAAADFTQFSFNDTEIANSFWIWNNIEDKYNTYNAASGVGIGIPNGQSDIPSHHGFWVKVLSGVSTANFTFTKSSLRANSFSYLKSASSGLLYPTFKMEAVFNGKKDETAIVFAENASNSLGDPFDTEKKLTSNIDYCQIFTSNTKENDITTNLAINGLQPSEVEISVPLTFKVAKTGIVTFNIKDLTLPPNSQVILEDTELNDFITLNTEISYQFEVTETGTNSSRFVIHFSGTKEVVTAINDTKDNNHSKKASFYTNNSGIIAYIGQLNNPSYRLLDINGKIIDSGRLNPESENRIAVSRKGMVILIVESEKEKLEFKTVF